MRIADIDMKTNVDVDVDIEKEQDRDRDRTQNQEPEPELSSNSHTRVPLPVPRSTPQHGQREWKQNPKQPADQQQKLQSWRKCMRMRMYPCRSFYFRAFCEVTSTSTSTSTNSEAQEAVGCGGGSLAPAAPAAAACGGGAGGGSGSGDGDGGCVTGVFGLTPWLLKQANAVAHSHTLAGSTLLAAMLAVVALRYLPWQCQQRPAGPGGSSSVAVAGLQRFIYR
jgi:hypothetical protein